MLLSHRAAMTAIFASWVKNFRSFLFITSLFPALAFSQVSVSPSSISFGDQIIGTISAAQFYTVTNTGSTQILMQAPSVSGEFSNAAGSDCWSLPGQSEPGILLPTQSCSLAVQFVPPIYTSYGAKAGSISVNYFGSSGFTSSPGPTLSGNVVHAPIPQLWVGSPVNFGSVVSQTYSAPYSLELYNAGYGPLLISGVTPMAGWNGEFIIYGNSCPASLPIGASCFLTLYYLPSTIGAISQSLQIDSNSPGSPHIVTLTGTGVIPGTLTSNYTTLTYPTQPFGVSSVSQTFTLSNTGGAPLSINGITANRFDYVVTANTCPAMLQPLQTCTVSVSFTPYGAGNRNGTISISHTGANGAVNVTAGANGANGLNIGGAIAEDRTIRSRRRVRLKGAGDDPDCNYFDRSNPACTAEVIGDDDPIEDPDVIEIFFDIEDWTWTLDDGWTWTGRDKDPCEDGGAGAGTPTGAAPPAVTDVDSLLPPNDIGKNVRPDDPDLTADPIHAAHGNKAHRQIDYKATGNFSLQYARTFNSLAPQSSAYVRQYMGAGWYGTWDKSVNLETNGTTARVTRGNGVSFVYTKQINGTWITDTDIKHVLTRQADSGGNTTGWQLSRNNRIENYGADGRMTSLVLKGGQTYTLTYVGTNPKLLDRVTDPTNRYLQFTYDTQKRLWKMTDPAGGITTYNYDTLHRLTSVNYADGRIRQYKYEHATFKFALTSIVNEAGVTYVTFTYDAQGRATGNTFSGNTGIGAITFNADGTSTANDASGATVTRGFQVINGNVKTTSMSMYCPTCGVGGSAGAVAESYAYDTNGMLTSHTNKKGVVATTTYNTRNLVASTTEAAGTAVMRTVSYTYHPTLDLPTQIIEPTKTTNITYDTAGRVLTSSVVADGQTRTTTNTYNTQGLVASVKGPRTDVNDTTTYTYDSYGNVLTITNPKNQTTTFSNYDMHGNARQINYPDGRIETRTFDARSRLLTKKVVGGTTTTTYDVRGLVTRTDYPDGTFQTNLYDSAHRLTGRDLSNGEKLRYTLDNAGRTTKTETFDAQNILSSTTSSVYDGLNRVTQKIDANNKVTSYTYDANGNVTAVADPNGLVTQTAYDALNRPILVTDPLAKTTAFAYNAQDKVTAITDPNNNVTTYSYSGFGENTQTVSPDTGTTTQTYNAGGMVVTKTDARGKTATYQYDVLGRISNVAYTDGAITQTYDVGANGVGRLSSVTDPSGSTSYTYDANGRTASKSTTINAPAGSGQANISKTVSYTRDTIGRITAITYPSGKVLGMAYADGRISAYTLAPVAGAPAPLISGIQYFPLGGPESWMLGANNGGKNYTRLIDLNGRIQKYTTPTGYRALTFDNASRITSITDYLGTSTTPNATQSFGYDNAGRLVSFNGFTSNGVNPTSGAGLSPITQVQSFTYDNNGNRQSSLLNGAGSTYNYQVGSNRLASVSGTISRSNTFDAAGNLVFTGQQVYNYDDRGRLKTAQNYASGITTVYSINHQQLRVRKGNANNPADTTNTRLYMYDDAGHMLGEYDVNGNAVQEFIWLNDTPVAVTGTMPCFTSNSGPTGIPSCTTNGNAYIFTDHLNTPREVARINGASYVSLWKWDSLPFGDTAPNSNSAGRGTFTFNHRFPGQYWDKETGLHQNWHRDYDAGLGRYVQSDPIGLRAGTNTFSYVKNGPLMNTDMQGLDDSLTPCEINELNDRWGNFGGFLVSQYNAQQLGTLGGALHRLLDEVKDKGIIFSCVKAGTSLFSLGQRSIGFILALGGGVAESATFVAQWAALTPWASAALLGARMACFDPISGKPR